MLSAHPDDEVLAVGGWLSSQTGRDVVFVTATDGEASHPGSPSITPDELRARRPGELVRALDALGFEDPQVRRLELPDGGLERGSVELQRALAPHLVDAALVLAPFEHDGHPDHDALGRAARVVADPETTIWQFPVWTWAWTKPGNQRWMSRVRRLECSSTDRHRKRRAIAAFATQVEALGTHPSDGPVVDELLLRHATHAPEVVIV